MRDPFGGPRGRGGMGHVLVVGWACLDYRFHIESWPPASGRTRALAYREALGGPAAVAAAAVAALGGKAVLLSRRGDDPLGDKIDRMLDRFGVERVWSLGEESPVSAVLITPQGERFIFPYAGRLPKALPDGWRDFLGRAKVVLADLRWPEAARSVLQLARDQGIPRVLDLDRTDDQSLELARLCSHVIASEDVATAVGGIEGLAKLLPDRFLAVTLGPKGVAWMGGHLEALPVFPKDTTGAGDVFHGAFVWALANGVKEEDGLRFANRVAGLFVATGEIPSLGRVEESTQGRSP